MGRTALALVTNERLAEYPACVVCGSFKLSELTAAESLARESAQRERLFRELSASDSPSPTQVYEARLVACDECGTLARDPHLSAEGSIASYTEDDYQPRWMEAAFRAYEAEYAARMPELADWIGPNARVLEIGSFVGGFLSAAERQGWRVEGVDVGHCVTSFARSKGLNVHHGPLADRCYPSRRFDAVFVWSCFDQLPEPWQQLHEIYRILDEGGRLLIRVPNGEFVKHVQRLERWAPSESIRKSLQNLLALTGLAGFPYQLGYTPASLSRMLRDCGFESIRVRNQIDMPRGTVGGRGSKALKCIHAGSELLSAATFGAINCGPWIELSCMKAPLAFAENELPLLCVA